MSSGERKNSPAEVTAKIVSQLYCLHSIDSNAYASFPYFYSFCQKFRSRNIFASAFTGRLNTLRSRKKSFYTLRIIECGERDHRTRARLWCWKKGMYLLQTLAKSTCNTTTSSKRNVDGAYRIVRIQRKRNAKLTRIHSLMRYRNLKFEVLVTFIFESNTKSFLHFLVDFVSLCSSQRRYRHSTYSLSVLRERE